MLDHAQVLADLRSFTLSSDWPRSIRDWKNLTTTNCLAFALGLDLPDPNCTQFYGSFYSISHPDANFEEKEKIPPAVFAMYFTDTCKVLGLNCRRITTPNDATADEYVMALWGMYSKPDNKRSTITKTVYSHDYHVIRRNLDGTWIHKEGWSSRPEVVEWKCLSLLYPERPMYFAVKQSPKH